jgi:hypothetical protein
MAGDRFDASPTDGVGSPGWPTSWAGQSLTLVPVDHDPFDDSWAAYTSDEIAWKVYP